MMKNQYAVYLPAVNIIYASRINKPIPDDRPFPNNLDLNDLAFWSKNNRLWHHEYYLHSIGQYKVGSQPKNAITYRNRQEGCLIGDSSGFQIGSGTLKGIPNLKSNMSAAEAIETWQLANNVKLWIIDWLETYTNYAMTIDMPLWSTINSNSPFYECSIEQLTTLTVENLHFINGHRRDKTKWLNVLQGLSIEGVADWWNAVKWFKCSGYALGGHAGHRGGLKAFLSTLLMMRDDNAFMTGRNWVHVLGISTIKWALIYTAVQQVLQKTANHKLKISFDSASPFQIAGIYDEYSIAPTFGPEKSNWIIRSERFPQSRLHVKSGDSLPCSSPIFDKLTLGDLNVRPGMYVRRQFDTLSSVLIANHNIWIYLDAFERANNLVFGLNRSDVPDTLTRSVDFIDSLFRIPNWKTELDNNEELLTEFDKW